MKRGWSDASLILFGSMLGLVMMAVVLLFTGEPGPRKAGANRYVTGTIMAKRFTPAPSETQITIGAGGVDRRAVDGLYEFDMQVGPVGASGTFFTVEVDPSIYKMRRVGDAFQTPLPAAPAK